MLEHHCLVQPNLENLQGQRVGHHSTCCTAVRFSQVFHHVQPELPKRQLVTAALKKILGGRYQQK